MFWLEKTKAPTRDSSIENHFFVTIFPVVLNAYLLGTDFSCICETLWALFANTGNIPWLSPHRIPYLCNCWDNKGYVRVVPSAEKFRRRLGSLDSPNLFHIRRNIFCGGSYSLVCLSNIHFKSFRHESIQYSSAILHCSHNVMGMLPRKALFGHGIRHSCYASHTSASRIWSLIFEAIFSVVCIWRKHFEQSWVKFSTVISKFVPCKNF